VFIYREGIYGEFKDYGRLVQIQFESGSQGAQLGEKYK
jgi:hypothetical protein